VSQCAGSTSVGTLVAVPSGGEDAEIDYRVVLGVDTPTESCSAANGYEECIVARRALRYIAHSQIVLPVTLTANCESIPCDASSTCVNGACVSSSIDPTSCPGFVCSSAQLGTGGSSDAGVVDATTTDASDGSVQEGSADGNAPPTTCTAPCLASFAPGQMHTCAVHSGAVECSGDDTSYQLGQAVDGGQDNAPIDVPNESMMPFTNAVGVTSGGLDACATLPNGTAQS
jgi:hypothetical protein